MLLQKFIISAVVLGVSGASIGRTQQAIDNLRGEILEDELLYIPSETLLDHFTAGMSNVIADLLWIETIKYTVKEFHNPERKFRWLEHMCNAVVDLDPYFVEAYSTGATFMSAIGSDEAAMDLLNKGFVRNPDSWEIPYEMVKIHILNRREEPESATMASYYLAMLAERHEYPDMYLSWARRIQEENNLDGEARAIWEDVLRNSDDAFIRELAESHLRILIIQDNVAALDQIVALFEAQAGWKPISLNQLVEVGLLSQLPPDEDQGTYFLGPEGQVLNTVLLEELEQRVLRELNMYVNIAGKERGGAKPSSLAECEAWLGDPLPEHPVPGEAWEFDVATGEIV